MLNRLQPFCFQQLTCQSIISGFLFVFHKHFVAFHLETAGKANLEKILPSA